MSEQPISQSRLNPLSLSRGLSVSSPTVKQDPSAQRSQAIGKALSQMSTAFAGAFGAKFKYDQAEELRKREEEIKAKKRQEDEFKIQGESLAQRYGREGLYEALKAGQYHPRVVHFAMRKGHELRIGYENQRLKTRADEIATKEWENYKAYRSALGPEEPGIPWETYFSIRINAERQNSTAGISEEFSDVINLQQGMNALHIASAKVYVDAEENIHKQRLRHNIDTGLETTGYPKSHADYIQYRESNLNLNPDKKGTPIRVHNITQYDTEYLDNIMIRANRPGITSDDELFRSLDWIDTPVAGLPKISTSNPKFQETRNQLFDIQESLRKEEERVAKSDKDIETDKINKALREEIVETEARIISGDFEDLMLLGEETFGNEEFRIKFAQTKEGTDILERAEEDYERRLKELDKPAPFLSEEEQRAVKESVAKVEQILLEHAEGTEGFPTNEAKLKEIYNSIFRDKELNLKGEKINVWNMYKDLVKDPFDKIQKQNEEQRKKNKEEREKKRYESGIIDFDRKRTSLELFKEDTIPEISKKISAYETLLLNLTEGDGRQIQSHAIKTNDTWLYRMGPKNYMSQKKQVVDSLVSLRNKLETKRKEKEENTFKIENANVTAKVESLEPLDTDENFVEKKNGLNELLEGEELNKLKPSDRIVQIGKIGKHLQKIASRELKLNQRKEYDKQWNKIDANRNNVSELDNIISSLGSNKKLGDKAGELKRLAIKTRNAQQEVDKKERQADNYSTLSSLWQGDTIVNFGKLQTFRGKVAVADIAESKRASLFQKIGEKEVQIWERYLNSEKERIKGIQKKDEKEKEQDKLDEEARQQDQYFSIREEIVVDQKNRNNLASIKKRVNAFSAKQLDKKHKQPLLTLIEGFQKSIDEKADADAAPQRQKTYFKTQTDMISYMGLSNLEEARNKLQKMINNIPNLDVDKKGKSGQREKLMNMASRFMGALNSAIDSDIRSNDRKGAQASVLENEVTNAEKAIQIVGSINKGLQEEDPDFNGLLAQLDEEADFLFLVGGDEVGSKRKRILRESTYDKLQSRIFARRHELSEAKSQNKTDPSVYIEIDEAIDLINQSSKVEEVSLLETKINTKFATDLTLTESSRDKLMRRLRSKRKPMFPISKGSIEPINRGRQRIRKAFKIDPDLISPNYEESIFKAFVSVTEEYEDWIQDRLENPQVYPKFYNDPQYRRDQVDLKIKKLLTQNEDPVVQDWINAKKSALSFTEVTSERIKKPEKSDNKTKTNSELADDFIGQGFFKPKTNTQPAYNLLPE